MKFLGINIYIYMYVYVYTIYVYVYVKQFRLGAYIAKFEISLHRLTVTLDFVWWLGLLMGIGWHSLD